MKFKKSIPNEFADNGHKNPIMRRVGQWNIRGEINFGTSWNLPSVGFANAMTSWGLTNDIIKIYLRIALRKVLGNLVENVLPIQKNDIKMEN